MKNPRQLSLYETNAIATIQQRKDSPVRYILEQQKLRTRQDLLKLRVAIDSAENIVNHDRELLHDIYREIIKDTNLQSQWESRKMKTKERPFKVMRNGEQVVELTKVLESEWFMDWMDAVLDSTLWGFSMIEFGDMTPEGEFLPFRVGKRIYDPINVIDRDNVKPEMGLITWSPGENSGIAFDDPRFTDYLMFVGSTCSFGLLEKAAKLILCKNNTIENWSEWAEIFGMDKRVGYTDTQGSDRVAFIKALRDMGTNAYGVFTNRDKIEYLGTNRSDAYGVYKEFLTYIDEQIAKLIFGQDVVTNNTGRVVGTVGENVANMYGANDARKIKYTVNNKLFPLMENLGFSWAGATFEWDTTEKMSLTDRANVDKTISDMGFKHNTDYINRTYGVEVEEKEEPQEGTIEREEKVRKMYGS